MTTISAAQVKALRDKTGVSMGDCKNALVEAGGDETKAMELLKRKYAGKLDTRADKEAANGRIGAYVNGLIGALVELRCETDFVSANSEFAKSANALAAIAAQHRLSDPNAVLEAKGADGHSGKDIITETYGKFQEKLVIARVATIEHGVAFYVHHNGKIGSVVAASQPNPEVAKQICMHIAAQQTIDGLNREAVDPQAVAEARSFMMEEAKGKPANIAEKMVEGKLNKWYAERVLLEQPFALDDKITIGQMAKDAGMTVTGYLKFELGVKK
ncbi:MAG: Elongation factor Ts [Phycisphaerae bacterium]|nr:Elongation factor Ts [Phycisphaerae bacterium]